MYMCYFFIGFNLIAKLMKMQLMEEDDDLVYGVFFDDEDKVMVDGRFVWMRIFYIFVFIWMFLIFKVKDCLLFSIVYMFICRNLRYIQLLISKNLRVYVYFNNFVDFCF